MTPQELKNSILQLAIQGKLVEQRPEEGMAAEQKKQVIKSMGSHKAEILDDEKTIDIPDSWEWAKLSELTSESTLNDGNWVLSKDMVPSGPVKLIQLGSIGNCEYKNKGFKYLTEQHFKELNGRQIYGGYMLINRLIGDRMLICILPEIDGILMTAVDACWIAPNDQAYNLKYIMYSLASRDFQEKVKALGRGTTRFRISKTNLINISFPLPPRMEQDRIVAKIEELLPLIDRYEKAWSRLEEFNKRFPDDMQKSILQMAIQGMLVEQRPEEGTGEELYQQIQQEKQKLIKEGKIKKEKPLPKITEEEKPFDIPESWRWVSVGNVCTNIQYGTSSKSSVSGKIAVLRMRNIQNGRIEYDKLVYTSDELEIAKYPLEKGDLLFNRTNSKELVGKTGIYKGEIPAIYAGYLVRISPVIMISDYLNYVMQTQYYWGYCQDVRSDAIGQSNINAEKLKRFVFPLPPLAEQKRIVARLEELLPLCEMLRHSHSDF